jgi:hypothetical protein
MFCRSASFLRNSLAVFCLVAAASLGSAQNTPASSGISDSKFDLYGGYGYFHPLNSGINGYQYVDIYNMNATGSITGFFNRYVGVQIEAA